MTEIRTGRRRKEARAAQGVRPEVESLEDRTLPANLLYLDFTPDVLPGESQRPSSFLSGFSLRTRGGRAPHFLDFNHDGKVNSLDAVLGSQEIIQDTARYYAGFDAAVTGGDLAKNTQLGWEWHLIGQQAPNFHVYVMYVGGTSFDGDPNTFGESYQAPPGYNMEFYAFDFTSSMIRWYMRNNPLAAPETFAQDAALTAAHELGHELGLGHVFGNPPGDTNIMNYNADPATANIPDRAYPLIELRDNNLNPVWGQQNPAQEVRDSLAGQPAYPTAGLTYSISGAAAPKRAAPEKTRAAEIVGGASSHLGRPDDGLAESLAAALRHHGRRWAEAVEALFAAA